MKVKMIKFNLPLDNARCKTIEDIQNNFNLPELIDHYKTNKLKIWCKVRKLDIHEELEAISRNASNFEIAESLCKIFSIDKEYINESVMIYEYINKYNHSTVGETKKIFDEYAKNYHLEYLERQKQQNEEESKKASTQLDIKRIKCIYINRPRIFSEMHDRNFLPDKKVIPLFLTYNAKDRESPTIRGLELFSDAAKLEMPNIYPDWQIEQNITDVLDSKCKLNEYKFFTDLYLRSNRKTHLPSSTVNGFKLYVYDVEDKLNIGKITNYSQVVNILEKNRKVLFNHIDKVQLLEVLQNG